MKAQRIILSRTDSIGDVILTLPVAGVLKELDPGNHIIFLGQSYTKEIIAASKNIDEFVDWQEISSLETADQVNAFKELRADIIIHVFPRPEIARLAKKANIKYRYGTTNRLYHWGSCNRLLRLSRKNSDLHESQLNLKLLKPFGAKENYGLYEIPSYYGLGNIPVQPEADKYLHKEKFNLVLHPRSKGSAREWGLDNFSRLLEIIDRDKFNVLITGTQAEGDMIREGLLDKHPFVTDTTGKLSLSGLIDLINRSDGLIAASTGPLHIAAALGKIAIGIYPPIRPMHPGRWAPIGENAHFLVEDISCEDCRKNEDCKCIRNIAPETVYEKLLEVAF